MSGWPSFTSWTSSRKLTSRMYVRQVPLVPPVRRVGPGPQGAQLWVWIHIYQQVRPVLVILEQLKQWVPRVCHPT